MSPRTSEARSMAPFRVVCQQIWIADWLIMVTFGMTVQQITGALGSAAGCSGWHVLPPVSVTGLLLSPNGVH